jgi:hypothetical protein
MSECGDPSGLCAARGIVLRLVPSRKPAPGGIPRVGSRDDSSALCPSNWTTMQTVSNGTPGARSHRRPITNRLLFHPSWGPAPGVGKTHQEMCALLGITATRLTTCAWELEESRISARELDGCIPTQRIAAHAAARNERRMKLYIIQSNAVRV